LKIRAHKLRAVIVPRGDASRDGFAESTKLLLYGLRTGSRASNRVPRLAA
jgi:hypothetical protein